MNIIDRIRYFFYSFQIPSSKKTPTKTVSLLPKEPIALEEQISVLASCGIHLHPDIPVEYLFTLWERKKYEKDPYNLLLVALGSEAFEQGVPYVSNNVFDLDTECIEDHGDYAKVAVRMALLAGEDLPLSNIEDYVSLDDEIAWLSFELDGVSYKWNAVVQDDWIDDTILTRLACLLRDRKTGKYFYAQVTETQNFTIGCCTPEQLDLLRRQTGLEFEWLV